MSSKNKSTKPLTKTSKRVARKTPKKKIQFQRQRQPKSTTLGSMRREQASMGVMSDSELDKCKIELAKAYANPFSAYRPCIGRFPNPPSLKATTLTRGSFACGTGGVGFIMAKYGLALDFNSIAVTGVTYAGTSVTPPGSGDVGVTLLQTSNSPVATSSSYSSSGLHWRPICMGIRIRYIGTLLNRRGMAFAATIKDDDQEIDSNTAFSISNIPEDAFASVLPITDKWIQMNYIDRKSSSTHYASSTHTYNTIVYAQCSPTISEAATFEFEVVTHFEVIGKGVQPMSTQNPTIPEGWVSSAATAGYDLLGKVGNWENIYRAADFAYKGVKAYNDVFGKQRMRQHIDLLDQY